VHAFLGRRRRFRQQQQLRDHLRQRESRKHRHRAFHNLNRRFDVAVDIDPLLNERAAGAEVERRRKRRA
jgi:hypothetical protein